MKSLAHVKLSVDDIRCCVLHARRPLRISWLMPMLGSLEYREWVTHQHPDRWLNKYTGRAVWAESVHPTIPCALRGSMARIITPTQQFCFQSKYFPDAGIKCLFHYARKTRINTCIARVELLVVRFLTSSEMWAEAKMVKEKIVCHFYVPFITGPWVVR